MSTLKILSKKASHDLFCHFYVHGVLLFHLSSMLLCWVFQFLFIPVISFQCCSQVSSIWAQLRLNPSFLSFLYVFVINSHQHAVCFFSFWIFFLLISSYDWLSRRPPLSISDLLIKFNRCQAFASMIVIVIFSLALALVLQEFSFSFRSGFALFFLPIPTVHKERIMCLILNRPQVGFLLTTTTITLCVLQRRRQIITPNRNNFFYCCYTTILCFFGFEKELNYRLLVLAMDYYNLCRKCLMILFLCPWDWKTPLLKIGKES